MVKYHNVTNLFAVIVADLTLETPDKQLQSYRFVYNDQEIPVDVFTPTTFERANLVLIIAIIVGLIVLLMVFAYLCVNTFVPMIARLKNRRLVEDGGAEKSGDNEAVPTEQPP